MKIKPRILFLITEDWYFWSHRLPLARAVRNKGFEVLIATRVHRHKALIEKEGFKLIPIRLVRRSKNIFHEILSILEIIKIYWKEKPDLVHHVSIKPVLYGSLAARVVGVSAIVNALSGLGFIFVTKGWRTWIFRQIVCFSYRYLSFSGKNTFVIFQNPEDMKLFINAAIVEKQKSILIRGSGVDTSLFVNLPEPKGVPIVVLASRMLWNKGISMLVEAARELYKRGIKCRIVLVGVPDPENPLSITEETLRDWNSEGIIEWWGYRKDMPRVLSETNIVVLPTTYGEGVPKILIEAASCCRPIVATDVPGCREIVRHNENGLLVPIRDSSALAGALNILIENPEMRKKMGSRGREIVAAEFSNEIVVKQTIDLYRKLLNRKSD